MQSILVKCSYGTSILSLLSPLYHIHSFYRNILISLSLFSHSSLFCQYSTLVSTENSKRIVDGYFSRYQILTNKRLLYNL